MSRFLRVVRLDSIKQKILVFALLATLVPSLSMALVSYAQNRRSLTEKIDKELQGVSTQTAREMDLWIKERLWEVLVFASSYEVSENLETVARTRPSSVAGMQALGRLTDYLNSVQAPFPNYEELLVIDALAEVIATSASEGSSITLPPDWLNQIRLENEVIGEPIWDEASKRTLITIASPIRAADNRLLGALAAKLNFSSVDALLQDFAPGLAGEVYLITPDGNLIVGSRVDGEGAVSAPLSEATMRTLVDRASTSVPYVNYRGQEVVGTLKQVPRLGWSVVAEIPEEEAFGQVVRLRNLTVLMVSGLLLAVGAIAYFLGLIIVRPLDRLTKGAAKVAGGDLAVDLPVVSGGEVGYLTEVFNDMVTRLRRGRQELSSKNEELERLSITDGLTGLYNRRRLIELVAQEARRSGRHEYPFSVLMIDVDHFKDYNDTFGHLAGDDVLVKLAGVLKDSTRDVDSAARYGGEEFLVVLPETDVESAAEVAERICSQMANNTFGNSKEKASVTLSIGVAAFPADGETPEMVIDSADAALYQAKRRGRNRVARASRRGQKRTRRGA